MTTRPPIPAEHRPILARLAELMLQHALAEPAKKTGPQAGAPEVPEASSTVVKLPSS
jgi:hypothetical protein